MRPTPVGTGARVRRALLALVVSVGTAAALAAPAGADPATGPDPAANASVVITPADGLIDGETINYRVNTFNGVALFGVSARICANDPVTSDGDPDTPYEDATFNFTGSSGVQCVDSAHILSGSLVGADYEKNQSFEGTEQTTGNQQFKVGKGTVQYANDSGFPGTLQCDNTHPCRLVVKAELTGGTSTFFSRKLTYASPTGCPYFCPTDPATNLVATPGNNRVSVSWTAPVNPGTAVHHYTLTAGFPCSSSCSVDTPNGTTTNATITGLTNGTQYPFSVNTVNTLGYDADSSAVLATPSAPRPDAMIKTSSGGSLAGDNTYNASRTSTQPQVKSQNVGK